MRYQLLRSALLLLEKLNTFKTPPKQQQKLTEVEEFIAEFQQVENSDGVDKDLPEKIKKLTLSA